MSAFESDETKTHRMVHANSPQIDAWKCLADIHEHFLAYIFVLKPNE